MPFLVLICLLAVCLPVDWPEPPFNTGAIGGIAIAGSVVAIFLAIAWRIARKAVRQLDAKTAELGKIDGDYGSARTYFFFAYLIGFLICAIGLGWGSTARTLATIDRDDRSLFIPGGELLILAPFFAIQIGSWCFFYAADRRYHELHGDKDAKEAFWGRAGYVLFLMRQQALFVFLPLSMMLGTQGLERLFPEFVQTPWAAATGLLAVPAFFIFVPLIVPPLLGLKRLPRGPILDRLEATARRLHFRYSRIYLWNTRGQVANAAVIGVVPWIRYVLFTDRLLDRFSETEIDAVLGHEIGHAHHFHLPFYAFFLLLSTISIGLIVAVVRLDDPARWIAHPALFQIGPLGLAACYMFVAFGIVSRMCERQADVFGCRAGSCGNFHCGGHDVTTVFPEGGRELCTTGIAAFIRAMKNVKKSNRMKRKRLKWSGASMAGKMRWIFRRLTGWLDTWLHSTIAKRIAFLQRVAKDPEIERRFQSRAWTLKLVIGALLSAAIVGIVAWKGWEILLSAN